MKYIGMLSIVVAVLAFQVNAQCSCDPEDTSCLTDCVKDANSCVSDCQDNDCYENCISDNWPGADETSTPTPTDALATKTDSSAMTGKTMGASSTNSASITASSSISASALATLTSSSSVTLSTIFPSSMPFPSIPPSATLNPTTSTTTTSTGNAAVREAVPVVGTLFAVAVGLFLQ